MSSLPITAAQAWHGHQFTYCRGQADSRIKTGEDYPTRNLSALWTMAPDNKPKSAGLAMIPSSYNDYDARSHEAQRANGSFVTLAADIDGGNHSGDTIQTAVDAFTGGAAWLIYSSAHSRPGDTRWRIILPLAEAVPFATWYDAQTALFTYLDAQGIKTDRALSRAGQLVYLPNVPHAHKTGTPLRGEDGEPLYFERRGTMDAPGLDLGTGAIAEGIAALRRQRAADEQERAKLKAEAERRRAARPAGNQGSLIDDFNAANSIADMLAMCGYEQCPRHDEDWRSPQQTGETYATRVMGSKWVSLSGSDAASGLGEKCAAGCYGDAFDLFAHYKHGGDRKAALRQLGAERRADNVMYPPQFHAEPPEWMAEAPLPEADDLAAWEPVEAGEDYLELAGAAEVVEPDDLLPLFDPADWQGGQPPERQWRWDSFIPDYQATLLTGAGAAGKSLATQQLCTCIAMGLPFLGIATTQARALYITCEDDLDELHRRQEAICAGLGITLEQTRGKLFLLSLQGEIGNELSTFDHEGTMRPAARYGQIERTCVAKGIQFVTLDNTAHTFSGNENDRNQVAAFVNLNNRLAKVIGGSVVMVGHPNKAGDSYSGSTAWENQVRSRLYLEIPKTEDGGFINPDMRVIRNEKANYSKRGSEVRFWWVKGAFIADGELPPETDTSVRESAQAGYENGLFLALLDKLSEQRRHVSHSRNLANYAPKVMAAMPEAKGLSAKAFASAMERLFMLDQIAASVPLWKGRDRHPVLGLARKNTVAGGVE